jgi:hypothetical protein
MASGMLIQSINTKKGFIWSNRFRSFTYTNSTGNTVTLSQYQVMGLITASSKVEPSVSTATDGSQIPRYILAQEYTVLNGEDKTVVVCFTGDVDKSLVVFSSSGSPLTEEDEDTEVKTDGGESLGTNMTCLMWNGIVLRETNEMTVADNA